MEWLGLGAWELSAVLGASVVATLALYLLRPRRRTVVVPHLELFEAIRAERRASAWLSRRIRVLSLLLALAIVVSLGMALGDPRKTAGPRTGRTTVILLDRSASMGATDVRPSRLERAKDSVRRYVRALGGGDRLCLVAVDHRATPLAPCTDDESTLLAALDAVRPLAVHEDLGHALRLAADLLADAERPEVLLVTDGASRPSPDLFARLRRGTRVAQLRVGRAGDNVAIATFAARRHPVDRTESEVLVELENPSDVERTVELVLSGDGRALDVSRLAVPARGRASRILRAVSGVDSALEARIRPVDGRPDVLSVDDVAHALLPPRAKVRVLAVTRDDLYLEAALLLDEHLLIETTDPTRYDPSRARAHDVIVFDSFVPPEAPGRPAIYLHPIGAERYRPFELGGTCERPYFERVERSERLLRYAALDDVNVAEAPVIRPAPGDRILGADPRCPLLLRGTRDGQPFLALAFDPRASDLPLRAAWPMLLLRAIEDFTDRGGDFASGYETGVVARVPIAGSAEAVTVQSPSGATFSAPVQEGRVVFVPVESGLHRLRAGREALRIAANLASPEESWISPSALPGVHAAEVPTARVRAASLGGLPWRWLAGLAFALLLFEWVAHHRRWTV